MSLAWYRKWRPSTFADVIGQDHVVTMLRSALSRHQVSHALLFCGPRGVGKTTCARLLAKSLNCQKLDLKKTVDPCGTCPPCQAFSDNTMIDCIEIDAASNRGIDDVRALRETISGSPVIGRKKIYIIDEVHMLTKEAFNALLKTLEEPPQHVVLILATTESAKIPATILSRCARFDFRPLSVKVLAAQVKHVAKVEGITLDEESARLIAEGATGSGRDALSLLQQISLLGTKPTLHQVTETLGFIAESSVDQLLALLGTDIQASLQHLHDFLTRGVDPEQLVRSVLHSFRVSLVSRDAIWAHGLSVDQMLRAGDEWSWALYQLKGHPEPLVILGIAAHRTFELWQEHPATSSVSSNRSTIHSSDRSQEPTAKVVEQTNTSTIDVSVSLVQKSWQPEADQQRIWSELIQNMRSHNHGLAALLQDAELLGIEKGQPYHITVGVHFPFHKARILEPKNRKLILDQLSQLTKHEFVLECTLVASNRKPALVVKKIELPSEHAVVPTLPSAPVEEDLVSVAEQLFAGGTE